jgi:hypothetical protein
MNDIEHLDWMSVEALVALSISVLGQIATIWVTVVFWLHNNTPIVKASTRELSYIILIGISLSYTATFVLIAKPTPFTCGASRVIPGVSFSLIYGALVTKTNRIARILAGSKKKIMTRKPRFMSATAQVINRHNNYCRIYRQSDRLSLISRPRDDVKLVCNVRQSTRQFTSRIKH